MEKLELKEIVGYLPYGLKVIYNNGETKDVISTMIGIEDGNNILTENHVVSMNFAFKPILRQLSELTKEIEVDGQKFVPTVWLRDNHLEFGISIEDMKTLISMFVYTFKSPFSAPYYFIQKLYSWHFDIHNLINRGLAIDINEI